MNSKINPSRGPTPYYFQKQFKSWDEAPAMLDIPTACELLHMSEDTVRRLCRNNELPAAKLGKNWLIDKEKLRAKFGM